MVSRRYAGLSRRDTAPEVRLRKALHAAGLRFRVQYRIIGLPRRKVDIAFTRWKVAVQVDGCFWHGCPEHSRHPNRNREWWTWKIARNQARDADTDARLAHLGWSVIHVWEHEETDTACSRIVAMIDSLRKVGKPESASTDTNFPSTG